MIWTSLVLSLMSAVYRQPSDRVWARTREACMVRNRRLDAQSGIAAEASTGFPSGRSWRSAIQAAAGRTAQPLAPSSKAVVSCPSSG